VDDEGRIILQSSIGVYAESLYLDTQLAQKLTNLISHVEGFN
jgi:hypothetical protein